MKNRKFKFETIEPKLDSLARCISRIESKKPFTLKELSTNFDLQDIVSVNLERSVQQTVDIATSILTQSDLVVPLTMSESFDRLEQAGWISTAIATRMKKAVGFRNLLVHEYESIDWEKSPFF